MKKPSRGLAWGCALLALFLFGTGAASRAAQKAPAQPTYAPPAKLSVAEAVAAALGENAGLKQAEESRLSSLSRLRIAGLNTTFGAGGYTGVERSFGDSTVSANLGGDLTYKNLSGTEASVNLSPFGLGNLRSSMNLSLRSPLMRGKGRLSDKSNLVLGARSDASVQDKELYLTRQSTALGVVEAYYQAVLERERVKVRERALAIAREVADGARKRADAGLVAEIEVSRAELRVARTRDELNLQNQAARGAMDRLMLAIGAGVGHGPELTDAISDAGVEAPGLGDAVKTALSNRGELGISDEQLSEKARELAMAKDRLRPGLDVVAGYNSAGDFGGLTAGSIFGESDARMGLDLVFPLDKRVTKEERDTASRQLNVLHTVRNFQMEQIAEQVRRAYRSLEAARASLEILDQNSKVAEENLGLAQRMVDEGLVSNRETLEAQESLTEVESGLLAAKTNVYLANLSLRYAMGEDITAVVSK
ncbi:MAG: TolC family protein [Armatimonadota bacterium]|nr:TolC family protein [Armatimonadota bacterium]